MKAFILTILILSFFISQAQDRKPVLKKYPKDVQQVLFNEAGIFRGFVFGEKKNSIKEKEKIKLLSETDSSLTYTMNIDADDFADVIYYFDTLGNANSFAFVFILQDENEEINLKTNLTRFYNEKFGNPKPVSKEHIIWYSKEGYQVAMKDTSDEAGMEIEIVYYKP